MVREASMTATRFASLLQFLRSHTFRSLAHRNYRFYFAGQLVSFIGSWMQTTALMWLVYIQTDDPSWPALLMIAQFVPTLVLGPITGSIADRFAKRTIVFVTQSLFTMTALVMAGLVAANILDPWLIFGLLLFNGIVQAIDFPTRLAYVPSLVPKSDLINAISLNSLLFNSARAIGPAGAGLLFWVSHDLAEAGWFAPAEVTRYGALACFVMNSLSYMAVLLALAMIDVRGSATVQSDQSQPTGYRQILGNLRLMALLVLTGLLSIFGWPALSLFPAYTRLALGLHEKEYSSLVSGLGLGALCAALTTASFLTVRRRGWFLVLGSGIAVLATLALVYVQSLTWAVVASSALGFGLILYLSTGQSTMQMSVDDHARGRAMSLWAMMLSASAPLGHLLAGQAAALFPVRDVLWVLSLGMFTIWLLLAALFLREWQRPISPPN